MWQELVHETKDLIVVKTGVVLMGNIASNLTLLMAQGVPITNMARDHRIALQGAMSYMRETRELDELKAFMATGYTQGREEEYRRKIVRLQDSIARNPVTKLVEAGLMPTIVEDLNQVDDPYSYKSDLVEKIEGLAARLPKPVQDIGRQLYVAHDTSMYRFLSRTTQLSDFVARYTLFQHLTSRKINPLSDADAILEASRSFINYDVPMQPGLQYLDDMGITMFMKYFLRVQAVLLKTAKDNPARMMMLILLNNLMDLPPTVLDSSAIVRIPGNPFEIGAASFPASLGDLPMIETMQQGMKLLK